MREDLKSQADDSNGISSWVQLVYGGGLVGFAGLCACALPFLRVYGGAPYVASAPAARNAMLSHCRTLLEEVGTEMNAITSLERGSTYRGWRDVQVHGSRDHQRMLYFVDLGSGSGDLVLNAAKLGICARGIERNPILVAWCHWKQWKLQRESMSNAHLARFQWGDMWAKSSVRQTDDVVVVFGVPSIMGRLGDKLQSEMRDGAWLLSNTFEVPGWKRLKVEGGVHFYQKQPNFGD